MFTENQRLLVTDLLHDQTNLIFREEEITADGTELIRFKNSFKLKKDLDFWYLKRMKKLLLFTVLLGTCWALSEEEYQRNFLEWSHLLKKSYHHSEYLLRFSIFRTNLDFITSYNLHNDHMTLRMNHFGDWTKEELQSLLGTSYSKKGSFPTASQSPKGIPTNFSWEDVGAVTPVKCQGHCGSCYAFSTTGSVESCLYISGKSLISLSEQNIVDCSGTSGNMGCQGGLMSQAMDNIIASGGIESEFSYPYEEAQGNCRYNSNFSSGRLLSYVNIAEVTLMRISSYQGDEGDLLSKLIEGPVSVAVDASLPSYLFYSSGIYYDPGCSSENLNHGVVAVGWGSGMGGDYWIVKNSWGSLWGSGGYIRMARNRDNHCGIATLGSLPRC